MIEEDPIGRRVFQPLVDAAGIDCAKASHLAASAFLVVAISLSLLRMATIDVAERPELPSRQALHVAGALILYPWMAWTARNGRRTLVMPFGALHLGMRLMFVVCVAFDVAELVSIVGAVSDVAMLRATMQFAENVLAASALYLAICRPPPPRARPATA